MKHAWCWLDVLRAFQNGLQLCSWFTAAFCPFCQPHVDSPFSRSSAWPWPPVGLSGRCPALLSDLFFTSWFWIFYGDQWSQKDQPVVFHNFGYSKEQICITWLPWMDNKGKHDLWISYPASKTTTVSLARVWALSRFDGLQQSRCKLSNFCLSKIKLIPFKY